MTRTKKKMADLRKLNSKLEINDTALDTKLEVIIAEQNNIRASCQAIAEQRAAFQEAIAKLKTAVLYKM